MSIDFIVKDHDIPASFTYSRFFRRKTDQTRTYSINHLLLFESKYIFLFLLEFLFLNFFKNRRKLQLLLNEKKKKKSNSFTI